MTATCILCNTKLNHLNVLKDENLLAESTILGSDIGLSSGVRQHLVQGCLSLYKGASFGSGLCFDC